MGSSVAWFICNPVIWRNIEMEHLIVSNKLTFKCIDCCGFQWT